MKVAFAQRGNHYDASDLEAVRKVMEAPESYNKWITIREFEKQFAQFSQSRIALATSSCTSALHLCLKGIELQEGDEVITSPWTWVATANVVMLEKARPVFVDIRPDTLNIDETLIEAQITPRTKAILPVHFAGHPCEMEVINKIARKHGLYVISDAAHAIGAEYQSEIIGSTEDLAAFSFYTQKNMSTLGEGGMVSCQDDAIMERMKLYQNHGVKYLNNYTDSTQLDRPWYRDVVQVGNNYRMSEVQAAVGMTQLKRVPEFNAIRSKYAHQYSEMLRDIPGIITPTELSHVTSSWHFYVIRVNEAFGMTRDELYQRLQGAGIETSVHYTPLHIFKPFQDIGYMPSDLPVAEAMYEKVLSLPLHPGLSDAQVRYVADTIRDLAV